MAKKISVQTATAGFSVKQVAGTTGMILAAAAAIATILTVFFVIS